VVALDYAGPDSRLADGFRIAVNGRWILRAKTADRAP
jgi:hypothetical protein